MYVMDTNLVLLHLSLIDGIGPATIYKILHSKPKSFELGELYTLHMSELSTLFGISRACATKIVSGLSNRDVLKKELSLIADHNMSWMTVCDEAYPVLLKSIHVPPTIIYWQGSALSHEDKCIAVVGSRAMNQYGECAIKNVVPTLVSNGWSIVSGGAYGADTCAHRVAIESGGKTIVVLGSGLLRPYPRINSGLFKKIIATGGTIVSSFPLLKAALPGNFPARNRIIAGLSRGCVVVQAAARSGACITAHCALEGGREVFAIPGPIDDSLSVGCHKLIQQGAKLVSGPHDILDEFGERIEQENVTSPCCDQVDEPDHSRIIHCCARPISFEALVLETGFSSVKLQELLFDLQISGKVRQNMMGMFERC